MIQDNADGTYTVQYTPEDCGPYEISVTYGGEPVQGVPFKTTAIPTGDASKCKITGKVFQTAFQFYFFLRALFELDILFSLYVCCFCCILYYN